MCKICDDTGWVCENHDDRPWNGGSKRADACGCGAGAPCECNPDGNNDRIFSAVICSVDGKCDIH